MALYQKTVFGFVPESREVLEPETCKYAYLRNYGPNAIKRVQNKAVLGH